MLNWDKDKAFEILTSLPTLAEACVIRWALQLAKNENLAEIIVESDAKVCVDTLNLVNVECNWNILTLCKDILQISFLVIFVGLSERLTR